MTAKEKELIKYQKEYLRLINKITELRLSGQNPPEKLLKEAQTVGRLGEIPEAFFNNIV